MRDANKDEPTIFVTKDVNLRIRADALGLTSMDFEAERIDIDELYSGMTELPVPGRRRRHVLRAGHAAADREPTLKANQYVLLRDRDNPSHSALGRFDGAAKKLVPLRKLREGVWGIRPRNKEQHCALDLLLNDDIKLVTLVGKAGTARRCSRSPPACRRSSRSSCTRSCWCRGRSSRSAATSATCPATSRRS